jgi:hypothetical protein
MCENLGPVEGWILQADGTVSFVKGCQHPLPRLFVTLRLLGGRKLWSPLPPVEELPAAYRVEESRCLGGQPALTADPARARLLSPLEAVAAVKACSRSICRAALELLELLATSGEDCIGVTGGLAYSAGSANDIDLVVYTSKPGRVYQLLIDLRAEGRTKPLTRLGHGWGRYDVLLHEATRTVRVLQGLYGGFEYNVKIVACRKPVRCKPISHLGSVKARGWLEPLSPFTVPATYRLLVESYEGPPLSLEPSSLLVYTLRLRYTEIPRLRVEVKGSLELWPGRVAVLEPDRGGYVKPLMGSESLEV